MKKVLSVLVVVMITCHITTAVQFGVMNSSLVIYEQKEPLVLDSIYHAAISTPVGISTDSDFVDQLWPGTGTAEDPFRLESTIITTEGVHVSISNTRAYFLISDCNFVSDSTYAGPGVELSNVTNAVIAESTFDSIRYGIKVFNSSNSVIIDNTFTNMMQSGIEVSESVNVTITGNSVVESWSTIAINLCSFVNVSGNNIDSCGNGVSVVQSQNASVTLNTIEAEYYGVSLGESPWTNVTGNTFLGCGIVLSSGALKNWFHTIEENTVNGLPILYHYNSSDSLISSSGYGQVIVVNCVNTTIAGGTLTNTSFGVAFGYCINSSVRNIAVSSCWYAISFVSSEYCNVSQITTDDNQVGLRLSESYFCTVNESTFSDSDWGIHLTGEYNSTIVGNEFLGCLLFLDGSTNATVIDNSFSNSGIKMINHQPEQWDHKLVDNLVNGRQILYFYNISGLTMTGQDYGQVILGQCNNISIRDSVFASGLYGLDIMDSYNITLDDCTLSEHNDTAINLRNTLLLNLNNLSISGNGNGVQADNCSTLFINDCNISTVFKPYMMDKCTNITITHTNFSSVYNSASWFISSTTIKLINCSFYSLMSAGVYLRDTNDVLIRNCTAVESEYGIYVYNSENCSLKDSTLDNNRVGIQLRGSRGFNITSCKIWSNRDYGVLIFSDSYENRFYYNEFGWNEIENAIDDGHDNIWDDEINTGNLWSDYSGSGTYEIPGLAESVDHFPARLTEIESPILGSPDDIQYECRTLGNVINWTVYDIDPDSFNVLRNGTEIDSDSWNGSAIIILIDGLNPGVYNYTLQVFDHSGNHASDTVFVVVVDTVLPFISHPDDIEFIEGTSGNLVAWDVDDTFPEWYEIYLNGLLDEEGIWNEESIVYNLDDFTVGSYNLTLVIRDSSGNSIQDSVQVSVRSPTSPTSPTTSDPVNQDLLLFGMIIGISSISVVIVVVLLIIYKRK